MGNATRACFFLCLPMLAVFFGCDRYEPIVNDLSQRDANEIFVLLREQKLDARKVAQSQRKSTVYHIEVRKKHAQEALRLLVHHQLPKTFRPALKDVYPPGAAGIIPSKSDEIARMIMATQGESEALLKALPGITDARVVIAHDQTHDFGRAPQKKSASIAVIYQSNDALLSSPLTDSEIKNLMAASIGGLDPKDIHVVQKQLPAIQSEKIPNPQIQKPSKPQNTFLTWCLMLLTGIALTLSGYALYRLLQQKREST